MWKIKIAALYGKNMFGIHLKMNVFLSHKASLCYTEYIYPETIFQFTTKRVIGLIISSGVVSISQPKGKPYCQSCRPKNTEARAKHLKFST